MKEKIYLAGKITGEPNYKEKFERGERWLFENFGEDIAIINPSKLPEGMEPLDYMAVCLPMLLMADMVAMLPGWEESAGASIEYSVAVYSEKSIVKVGELNE